MSISNSVQSSKTRQTRLSLADALRQFSCPQEPWDDRIFATVMSASRDTVIEQFLELYQPELHAESVGLTDALRVIGTIATRGQVPRDLRCDCVFGTAQRAVSRGSEHPTLVAANLAISCSDLASTTPWTATFRQPVRLRLGHRLLPATTRIEVRNEGGPIALVALRDERGRTCKLRLGAAQSVMPECDALIQVGGQSPITLLPRSAIPDDLLRVSPELSLMSVLEVRPDMTHSIQSGIDMVDRYARHYRDWIDRTIVEIIVCRHEDSRNVSGSWPDAPGSIQLGWSPDPVTVAEALVHEASHQYAYQVSRVGPVDDASDTTLYYSPAIDRDRPLDRILLAYHAFANILLFYIAAVANGMTQTTDVTRNMNRVRTVVEQLDGPLRQNPALTAIGRSLYGPLSERLKRYGT